MGENRACIKFKFRNSEDGISEQYIFIPDKIVNNDIKRVSESIIMTKKFPNLFSKDCENRLDDHGIRITSYRCSQN